MARRYAAALFELGRERGELDRYIADLERVRATLREQPAVRILLENPRVTRAAKEGLLARTFADLRPAVRNLLRLLVRKRREPYLEDILDELLRLREEAEGIVRAEVRVAVPLPEEQTRRVQERLEQVFGRRLRLQVRVQPDLLGGLIVQVGDRRVDASLRRRLQVLRERMAEGAAVW